MLEQLTIKNFALIDSIQIDFSNHLNILTGETGAGKSIIIGALGLITGTRSDSKSFYDSAKKCVIEANVRIDNYDLHDFFNANDIDYQDVSLLRRELTVDGKSRAFINDTPVSIAILKSFGELLIDIHSQFDTLSLNKEKYQLYLIDSFCNHKLILDEHSITIKKLLQQKKNLELLKEKREKAGIEQNFIQFQFDELEEAKLKNEELENLEREAKELSNADVILSSFRKVSFIIQDNEISILSSLQEIVATFSGIEKYYEPAKTLNSRVRSLQIELKDIASECELVETQVTTNDQKLQEIEQRLSQLNSLLLKHRKLTVNDLIDLHHSFSNQLLAFTNLDEEIEILKKEIEITEETGKLSANKISKTRKEYSPKLTSEVEKLLQQMGMPDAKIAIDIKDKNNDQMDATGKDSVQFLFSSNKGFELKELGKIASGGELSRLMLAIKSVLARVSKLPTIIFDEIDSGISGEVAQKMGVILEELSKNLQVITITHLPQIASKNGRHFMVRKSNRGNQTVSTINELKIEDRVMEIAKMLSGDNPSNTAMENAKELLKIKI